MNDREPKAGGRRSPPASPSGTAGEATGAAPPATTTADPPARRARPCPICGALAVKAFHPFCSKRCADVDLHRWFSGSYRIAVVEETPDEDEHRPDR